MPSHCGVVVRLDDDRRDDALVEIQQPRGSPSRIGKVDVPGGDRRRRGRIEQAEVDVLLPQRAVLVVLVAQPVRRGRCRAPVLADELISDRLHLVDTNQRGVLQVRQRSIHPEIDEELGGIGDGRHVHLALVVAAHGWRRETSQWFEVDEILDRQPVDRHPAHRIAHRRLDLVDALPFGRPLDVRAPIPAVGREDDDGIDVLGHGVLGNLPPEQGRWSSVVQWHLHAGRGRGCDLDSNWPGSLTGTANQKSRGQAADNRHTPGVTNPGHPCESSGGRPRQQPRSHTTL